MKKRFFALLLIFLLLLPLTSCKSQEEKQADQAKLNWQQSSDETKMGIYCALVKEYMLLMEDLGEGTPYPAMKRNVKGYMLSGGMTQQEALDNAEQVILEEQAVFWRGERDGVQVTKANVKAYIEENVLQELKGTESYKQVDQMCQEEGITFEDTIWAYEHSYKMEYIAKASGINNEEEFSVYKADAVEAYMESDAYQRFQVVIKNCRKLLADDVTDKDIIGEADIYW